MRSKLPAASRLVALLACAGACSGGRTSPPDPTAQPVVALASAPDAATPPDATPPPPTPRWLKGNTHTHTDYSGDSQTDPAHVVRWYTEHDYDFVVFTDHNLVRSHEHDGDLLVMPGVELTHNPSKCDPPPPEPRGHCRIHVNALFANAQPADKLAWSDDKVIKRVEKYQLAFDQARKLDALIQVNHPNWHWGIDGPMLVELSKRGALLVEIANQAFVTWNVGRNGKYPSMDEIWDAALSAGATIWGVASDDAHNYYDVTYQRERRMGFGYPPGGGFVVVWALKDPEAIREALAAGRFYSSTGVMLDVAEATGGEYRIEVAAGGFAPYKTRFIGQGGAQLAEISGTKAAYRLSDAPTGYVRAVVTDKYGRRAWTQPVRVP